MHAIPVTQPEPLVAPGQSTRVAQPVLHEVAAPTGAAMESAEVNRWIRLLTVPFVLSAAFFMALLSTGQLWLVGGVLVTGPGLLIMSFIYLSMSSDSNGEQ
jgi:hypothetical protein